MSSATVTPSTIKSAVPPKQSILLVLACTLVGAAAQLLIKSGMNQLTHITLPGVVTNVPLIAGYSFYGLNLLLLTIALQKAELSALYPIIALTYVWVTALSVFVFNETLNVYKIVGVTTIVFGVSILGWGGEKK